MAAAASFLILGQIQSPGHPSRTAWFAAAIFLLIVGLAAILISGVEGVRQYKESRTTPLEIEHDPEDYQCVQSRFGDFADLQLRIKVRNTGRAGLNHVRAQLENERSGTKHWLRIQHDNTTPFRRSLEGEMLPADLSYRIYFDVAYSRDGDGLDGWVFLEYADDYLKDHTKSRQRQQMLTIKVWASREDDGKSVLPAEMRFKLEQLDDGPGMRLTEADAK